MSEELRKKIRSEIQQATWRDLKLHQKRGGLVWVHPELVLEEVALSVALDDSVSVKAWMKSQWLIKVVGAHFKEMEHTVSDEKSYTFVIIQPFVLFQDLGH